MLNNDIIRRLRYALKISDKKVIECFKHAGHEISQDQLTAYFKKETDEGYKSLNDKIFSHFLNGLIIHYRGQREDKREVVPAKVELNNNEIMKKLRVALQLKDTDIVEMLELANFKMTKSELGAIFRKKGHPQFKECGDQVLRNLIQGIMIKNSPKENDV